MSDPERYQGWADKVGGPPYQGWCNRETWAVHLWLSNHSDLYRSYKGLTAGEIERGLTGWLGAVLSDHEERDLQQFMLFEIGSLWRVNWDEIARALTTET